MDRARFPFVFPFMLGAIASLAGACATYSPPPAVPEPVRPVERGAVIAWTEAALPHARAVGAVLGRQGEFQVETVGDPRRRLQELAGVGRVPLQRASILIDEALRQAGKLDGAGARRALAQARALLPEVPAATEEIDTWAALQSAGAVLSLLDGDAGEALRLLRGVAVVRPLFVPPSSVTPPEALALLRRAQVECDAAPRISMEVHSTPPGAEIVVDGLARGRSPVRLELPQGTHFVTALALGLRAPPHATAADSPANGVVHVQLAPAPSPAVAADALMELGRSQMTPVALRLAAMALAVEHLALLDGREALIWNASAPATMIVESTTGARQNRGSALAALIAARWERIPPAIGAVTVVDDSGRDTPWYRLWWGWVVAVLAAGITLSLVR